jgi:hypothetical protein
MRSVITTAVLILTAAGVSPVLAQEPPQPKPPTWRVTLAPRFGVFMPDKGMGESEAEGSTLTMTASPSAGLDIELRTPARWLSLRAIAETSVGSRLAERGLAADAASCTAACDERADELTPIGESSVLTLVADALVRPWTEGLFQPFLFSGAGVKRYDLTHANRLLDGGQESAFTFHFGGGLDVPMGPIVLSFEAADYVSLLHAELRPGTGSVFIDTPPSDGSGTPKHDFFLTLGIRLFPY